MPELVYLNGWRGPFEDAFISVNDRGYIFGDGVYEVIRVYSGKMFALQDHLRRLEASAKAVEINLPGGKEKIGVICEELLNQSRIKEAMVYVQLTRGTAPRNHIFDYQMEPNLLVTVRHLPEIPASVYSEGTCVITHPDFRWHMCNVKSISLQANILAKQKAHKSGALEAIFVLDDGTVTEAASSNVFMVKGEVLKTHPLGNKILPGITRDYVIRLARSLELEVQEEAFSIGELLEADEVFCTNTIFEVMPVVRVDDKTIGNGRPGKLTNRLCNNFKSLRSL
jgi:D-alanine transaminase